MRGDSTSFFLFFFFLLPGGTGAGRVASRVSRAPQGWGGGAYIFILNCDNSTIILQGNIFYSGSCHNVGSNKSTIGSALNSNLTHTRAASAILVDVEYVRLK